MTTKCLPAPPERWVRALQWPSILHKDSGSQPWDVFPLIPALSSLRWIYAVLGGWKTEAEKFSFLPCCDPRFEWQLSEMNYVQSLCSQVKPVTVRMVYYVSDVQASLGDEEGEQGLLFSALLESHILKTARKSVEEKGSEILSGRQSNVVKHMAQKKKKKLYSNLQIHFYSMHQVWCDTDLYNWFKSHLLNILSWFHSSESESKQGNLHKKRTVNWELTACSHKYPALIWAAMTC